MQLTLSSFSTSSTVVDTIAGVMDLSNFERRSLRAYQVTKRNWIDLQRTERRRLGQNEGGDCAWAPNSEYEAFHEDEVKGALQSGVTVDAEVMYDYPHLARSMGLVDPNIGRTWNSRYGVQKIAGIVPGGSLICYSVLTERTGVERRYSGDTINETIRRQEYELTPEYARELAEAEETTRLRLEQDSRLAEKHRKELEEIAAFTKGCTPMAAAKKRDALLKNVLRNGSLMNRKAMIEQAVAENYTVVSRNGARELTSRDGVFLAVDATTKTGMDYAEFLIAAKNSAGVAHVAA